MSTQYIYECGCLLRDKPERCPDHGAPFVVDFTPVRESLIADLLAALREAVVAIRVFHGDVGWDLYQHSPEMKRINAAIAKAEGATDATPVG